MAWGKDEESDNQQETVGKMRSSAVGENQRCSAGSETQSRGR